MSRPEQPWSSVQLGADVAIVVGALSVVSVVAIVPVNVVEAAMVV